MDFNKEDRPVGEKVERRWEETKQNAKEKGQELKEDAKGFARRAEGAITGNQDQKREHEPSSIEKAFDKGKDRGADVKEDLKGAARRVEGEITGNEGVKREHDPSILERAGEAISGAAQYTKETVVEGAKNIGLISEETAANALRKE